MEGFLLYALILFSMAQLFVLIFLFLKVKGQNSQELNTKFDLLNQQSDRLEKTVRDEISRNRDELAKNSRELREELATSFKNQTDSGFKQIESLSNLIRHQLEQIQDSNAKKLEEMRHTVDEKLQGTLEKRLGESFKQVSERLEQVHKGLGEMQNLASGVGDLKRVLTNVKTRGTWGEIQLRAILEQILLPTQFEANVKIRPDSRDNVEFAIKLPGREEENKSVWLPIDSKFPKESYERIMDAQDKADPEALKIARDDLARSLKGFAKDIRDLYISPPLSTDFAVLFVPTEGLFAEICRYPGLVDGIQRDFRVTVAGPTTLAALLNSLQMGFQTLAIQKRSSEVWEVLGAVKTEFNKFGEILIAVEKKLDEAKNKISAARSKSNTITRRLKGVHELPQMQTNILIGNAEESMDLDEEVNS